MIKSVGMDYYPRIYHAKLVINHVGISWNIIGIKKRIRLRVHYWVQIRKGNRLILIMSLIVIIVMVLV
jgi:hypothetical protein